MVEDARLAAEARRRAIEEDELAERELDRQTAMFRGQQLQPATGGDGFRRETRARNAVMASGLDMHATHQESVPQDQLAAELQECFEEPLEAPSKYGDLPVYTVGQLVAGPYPMVPGWCVGDTYRSMGTSQRCSSRSGSMSDCLIGPMAISCIG